MSKPLIITSIKGQRRGQVKGLRGLLKYLQFRDGSLRREAYLRDGRYPEALREVDTHTERTWVDRGMGESYQQIVGRAHGRLGRRLLARTWVISPDPELMQHVPKERQFEVVAHVTERALARWYGDNGWGQPEYSYVLHDKARASDGLAMKHSHVITPATIPLDAAEDRGRIDHIVRKPHIRDLHRTVNQTFEQELGRVLGRDRAQQLILERNQRVEREHSRKFEKQHQFQQLRALGDVMILLQQEKEARNRKKIRRKVRQRSRRRRAELRMYARYIDETRQQRQDADRVRMRAVIEAEREEELALARAGHQAKVERLKERGERIPTHAEVQQMPERKRQAINAYYAQLIAAEERKREQGRERA